MAIFVQVLARDMAAVDGSGHLDPTFVRAITRLNPMCECRTGKKVSVDRQDCWVSLRDWTVIDSNL